MYFLICLLFQTLNANLAAHLEERIALQTDIGREIRLYAKSAEIRNYMSKNVKPCDDFYAHACGNWAKLNPTTKELKTDVFSVLHKSYRRRVVQLLNGSKSSDENLMSRRVKYFYESCMKRGNIERELKEKLLVILEDFGGMPLLKGDDWNEQNFDWLETCARILGKYGKQIILGVEISPDLLNNEVNRLYIGQLDKLEMSRSKDFNFLMRLELQLQLQDILGLSPDLATKTAKEIANFEFEIAVGVSDPHDGLGLEDQVSLRLLDQLDEKYSPTLNLTNFVKTWLGYEYRLPVYEYVESYLSNLCKVIEKTPKRIVANYIMWQLWREFYIKDEDKQEMRMETCIKKVMHNFNKYLDHIAYKDILQWSPNSVDQEVKNMWNLLKSAFEQRLKSSDTDWLGDSTRKKALQKLSAMKLEISSYENEDFEMQYSGLVITTEHFFENLCHILELRGRNFRIKIQQPPKLEISTEMQYTPSYASEYNTVYLPVSFLQPGYFWDDVYPAALKFSTVGYMIAHEIAHGFDDRMRKYDAKGNLKDWWDRNSTEEFLVRKNCLRQQFSEFHYNGTPFPKMEAQGENIADNVGLRIAYTAYTIWLAENNTRPYGENLPNLKNTPQQLFFLSLAQLWCVDVNSFCRQMLITTDTHAPEELRVRGMLANFDEFASVFQCRVGANMHPSKKCVIY